MGWLSLLKIALQFASTVANYLREAKLMDAGAKAEVGRMLADIAHKADVAAQTRVAIAAMSDEDLNRELRGE